jgi:PKD repeat protein
MKHFFILSSLIFLFFGSFAQEKQKALQYLHNRGEVYFKINSKDLKTDLQKVGNIVSVDKITSDGIIAYANKKEFERFLSFDIDYKVLTPPSLLTKPVMRNNLNIKDIDDWDFYPTYEQYETMMQQFVNEYPNLCELVTMTTLSSGRKLLLIHINNDLTTEQNEPEFLYTSTMHGDEVTGYVLMLHFIDYLLSNYGTDTKVTNLVNNVDIWINPLANPDGTYAGGNNTVYGATRSNGNYVDLNRNYPDPDDGPHPDGEDYQPETIAFMQLAEDHNFVISANFHGGAEVVNYPWDTWAKLTADDNWWYYVSRQYADTVHANSSTGYFTDLNNGVTNGYAWYTITGGRQDYMNYYRYCRESTIELSSNKMPPASSLPNFWNYTYKSMLNYMEQSLYSLRGVITDAETGLPIEAEVYIEAHDKDNSQVYSSLPIGDYHRLLKAGTYSVTFEKYGYIPQTISVTVQDDETTIQNIQLQPIEDIMANFHADKIAVATGEGVNFFDDSYGDIVSWSWSFPGGTPSTSNEQNPQNIKYFETGTYSVSLTVADGQGNEQTLTKENYINVSNIYIISNTTVTTCNGTFYDTGGENGNYSDNEDITMTFIPGNNDAKIKVEFEEFNIEFNNSCNYDYLKIYDGSSSNGQIIGTFCGTDNPGTIEATNDEGALTFIFHSDYSVNESGWKALISCTGLGVGVNENNNHLDIIYPNPFKDNITVKSSNIIRMISITDLSGKEVFKANYTLQNISLNLSKLNSGIYLMKIVSSDNISVKKIIKR